MPMRVYQIHYPGSFLNLTDPTAAHQIFSLVNVIETALVDAAVALTLFESKVVWNPPMPYGYEQRIPFIHARTFLYALDTIRKSLDTLAEKFDLPPEVKVV